MRLPTAQDLGGRPSPEPSLGIARYQPVTGEGDAAQAVSKLGSDLHQTSDILFREQERIDNLRAEDAFNQLLDVKNDLTTGQKNGLVNYKGGDAISRPLLQQYSGRLDESINEISGKLSNDQQRAFFQRRANIARLQLREDVQKHQFAEGQKFETTTMENATRTELQNIQSRPLESQVFEMSTKRLEGIINNSSFSPEQKDLMKSKMLTAANTTVIENALASGNDIYAKDWYKAHEKEIFDPEGALKKKVETNSTLIKAGRFVQDLMDSKDWPQSDTAPLNMDIINKKLMKEFKDDPVGLRAARAELETNANIRNNAIKQREDFHLSTVSKLIDNGSDMSGVRNSKSFQSLDGQKQLHIIDYMKNRSKGIENITADQFASYQELSKPDVLAKMSTEAIESTVFNLGNDLTNRLLKKKELYAKEPEAKVDAQDLNHFIRTELKIDPESKSNKPRVGELQYTIENVINAEQNNKGRKLTREEKSDIIQKQTLQTMVDRPFWNKTTTLGEVTPEQFPKAYVPLDKIPPESVLVIRKRAAELGAKITPRHIERAYFLRQKGADGKALDNYLKGPP